MGGLQSANAAKLLPTGALERKRAAQGRRRTWSSAERLALSCVVLKERSD
jgi:hypothetical protein